MEYFVVSDIHSHYTHFINALKKTEFKQNDDGHMLIVNGDVFDRGPESQEVKDFLDQTNNKICIIGNHELLLLEAINRGYFKKHDLENGTIDAAIQLTGGYDSYKWVNKYGTNKAKDFFKVSHYVDEINHEDIQRKIIKNLININIVEWIVDNFYTDVHGEKKVIWDSESKHFHIIGRPRYYIQIDNRLIIHGFFPSPDWVKTYSRSNGQVFRSQLPDDFDILDQSSQEMWEEYGCGVWANTPYWLKHFYKYKLSNLYDYLVRRDIKHIYMGHWTRSELVGMVVTVSFTPIYEKYNDKLPELHFTDDAVAKTGNVIIETFTI